MHHTTIPEWITAIAALVALLGAAVTIFDNRRTAKQRLTYEYIARLEDPRLIEIQALMSSFLRAGIRPRDISRHEWSQMDDLGRREATLLMWRDMQASSHLEDRKMLLEIVAYPNMLEGLAGMYNHGLLNRRIVKTHVESEARDFCEVAAWWLKELKPSDDDNTFIDLETMIADLARQHRPRWHH
jgi:hypothetical protein